MIINAIDRTRLVAVLGRTPDDWESLDALLIEAVWILAGRP